MLIVWPCEGGGRYRVRGAEDSVYVGGKALGFLDIIDKEDAVTSLVHFVEFRP